MPFRVGAGVGVKATFIAEFLERQIFLLRQPAMRVGDIVEGVSVTISIHYPDTGVAGEGHARPDWPQPPR